MTRVAVDAVSAGCAVEEYCQWWTGGPLAATTAANALHKNAQAACIRSVHAHPLAQTRPFALVQNRVQRVSGQVPLPF